VILFRPHRSRGDEPSFEAIRGRELLTAHSSKIDSAVRWVFCALFGTMSKVNCFIPSNIRKSLQSIPCEGVCYILVQFLRVDYKIFLHRFLGFQTSPLHFDFVIAPIQSCLTDMFHILRVLINSDTKVACCSFYCFVRNDSGGFRASGM